MAGYSYIPFIANPQTGVRPVGWLQSNYYSTEAWFSTQTNRVVKCAYLKRSSTLVQLSAGALGVASGVQLQNVNNYSQTINWATILPSSTHPNIYFEVIDVGEVPLSNANPDISIYENQEEILNAFDDGNWEFPSEIFSITYRPTNCSFPSAPVEAAVGDTVVVPVIFPDGYGLVSESNIYVTNNGVVIPSTYSNGQLTFTMPDPS